MLKILKQKKRIKINTENTTDENCIKLVMTPLASNISKASRIFLALQDKNIKRTIVANDVYEFLEFITTNLPIEVRHTFMVLVYTFPIILT